MTGIALVCPEARLVLVHRLPAGQARVGGIDTQTQVGDDVAQLASLLTLVSTWKHIIHSDINKTLMAVSQLYRFDRIFDVNVGVAYIKLHSFI